MKQDTYQFSIEVFQVVYAPLHSINERLSDMLEGFIEIVYT